jgi:CRP-like cAMP-binding protein
VLNVLEPHDILGENALFEDSRRTATVQALTDGELLVFGKRDMLNMARKSPVELFMIMDSMSAKLDRTNENYCKALIELEKQKGKSAALETQVTDLSRRVEELEAESAGLKRDLEQSRVPRGDSPAQ